MTNHHPQGKPMDTEPVAAPITNAHLLNEEPIALDVIHRVILDSKGVWDLVKPVTDAYGAPCDLVLLAVAPGRGVHVADFLRTELHLAEAPAPEPCPGCSGKGWYAVAGPGGTVRQSCPDCKGSGVVS